MGIYTDRGWLKAYEHIRAEVEAFRQPIREAVASAALRGLADVPFASERARELARQAGLAWPAFDGVRPNSPNGFTAADVRSIIADIGGTE